MRMDIIEASRAKTNPVGKGRTEPNHSPYLPPPTGRISWTWNPFKMIVRRRELRLEPTDWTGVETEILHVVLLHLLHYNLHCAGSFDFQQLSVVCDREHLLSLNSH